MKCCLAFFAVLLVLYSCGNNTRENSSFKVADDAAPKAGFESEVMDQSAAVAPDQNIFFAKKLIKEGEIRFETSDVKETKKLIENSVKDLKGYISSDQINDYEQRIEYHIVVRVPADNFDNLLDTISESAARVEVRNVNVRDVTEEFVDIEARLRTKKELEERYKELMKKATRVEDLVSIEREIGNLRSEIESIEGRLKYLQSQVSMSTLNITFYERTTTAFGFNFKLSEALKDGWSNFLGFLIVLVNLWPFIAGGLFVMAIVFVVKRRKAQKRT